MWSVDVLMPPPRIVNHSASTHEYIDALTNNETLVLPASLKSGKRKRNKIKKKMLPTGMKALFVALKAMNWSWRKIDLTSRYMVPKRNGGST